MSGRLLVGGLVGLVALVLLGATLTQCGSSVRDHIRDEYDRVGTRDGAEVYASGKPVATVTREITDEWTPADRITSPSGVFLRYSDTIVAIHPARAMSRTEIEVADDRRGYGLWFPFIGGWFGSSGRGGTVRGGGPGGGK